MGNLHTENPKEYWNLIDKLKNDSSCNPCENIKLKDRVHELEVIVQQLEKQPGAVWCVLELPGWVGLWVTCSTVVCPGLAFPGSFGGHLSECGMHWIILP